MLSEDQAQQMSKRVMLLVALLITLFQMTMLTTASDVDNATDSLRNVLEAGGLITQLGYFNFFFLSDCARFNLSSCFALNADSPYGLVSLPPASGESTPYRGCVDDDFPKSSTCGTGCNPSKDPELTSGVCYDDQPVKWRLGSNEAVILIGTAPPKCKYWSMTSYLSSQFYEDRPGTRPVHLPLAQSRAVACRATGPARCQYFASLAAPFNYNSLRALNLTGFGESFALILTASKALGSSLSASILATTGIRAALIPYPGADLLKMGVNSDEADEYTFLMRVAYPSNETEMRTYYSDAPIRVMRVTTPGLPSTSDLFTKANMSFPSRRTGAMERAGDVLSSVELQEALDELERAIQAKHGGKGRVSGFEEPHFVTGLDCIEQGTKCNGDAYDTLYPISSNIFISGLCAVIPVRTVGALVGLAIGFISFAIFVMPSCSTKKVVSSQSGIIIIAKSDEDAEAPAQVTTCKDCKYTWFWARFKCCACFTRHPILFRLTALALIIVPLIVGISVGGALWSGLCQYGRAATMDGGASDFFVVFGVNHASTNLSTYASVTAYRASTLTGITSQSSEREYTGSAHVYLPASNPAREFLFAYRYSRDCATAGLAEDGFCYTVGAQDLPKNEEMFFIERAYVSPITGVGPLFNETITAKLVHFL